VVLMMEDGSLRY